jgi:hypothetical protein
VHLQFVDSESFFSYSQAAENYFQRYGKPVAFYSDKHGVFRVNMPSAGNSDAITQFGRAMQELDIKIICANTPQAKGRVERVNQLSITHNLNVMISNQSPSCSQIL